MLNTQITTNLKNLNFHEKNEINNLMNSNDVTVQVEQNEEQSALDRPSLIDLEINGNVESVLLTTRRDPNVVSTFSSNCFVIEKHADKIALPFNPEFRTFKSQVPVQKLFLDGKDVFVEIFHSVSVTNKYLMGAGKELSSVALGKLKKWYLPQINSYAKFGGSQHQIETLIRDYHSFHQLVMDAKFSPSAQQVVVHKLTTPQIVSDIANVFGVEVMTRTVDGKVVKVFQPLINKMKSIPSDTFLNSIESLTSANISNMLVGDVYDSRLLQIIAQKLILLSEPLSIGQLFGFELLVGRNSILDVIARIRSCILEDVPAFQFTAKMMCSNIYSTEDGKFVMFKSAPLGKGVSNKFLIPPPLVRSSVPVVMGYDPEF